MSPAEVLGVEIKQFSNKKIKTLVPRVIGKTSNAEIKKGLHQYSQWTEETFYEELKKRNGIKVSKIIRNIINHIEGKVSRLWYGQGKKTGSIIPIVDIKKISNPIICNLYLWKNRDLFSIFEA